MGKVTCAVFFYVCILIRLEKNHTNMKLLEISWEVGYESANYFSTVFKKVMGMTPSAYRQGHVQNEF